MTCETWPTYNKQDVLNKSDFVNKIKNDLELVKANVELTKQPKNPWDVLSEKQRMVLRCLNPLEYGFTQKETAIIMKLSVRQVRRIFRQFKIGFPEVYERFIKLKKDVNKSKHRHENKPPFLFGECDKLSVGETIEVGHRKFKVIAKF